VSTTPPSPAQLEDLHFAWRVVRHAISNGIVIAHGGRTLGIGAGQSSRVDAVRLALLKAERRGHDVRGGVLCSDAFLPFPDSVEIAAEAGIAAIAHPGGSVRDNESVAAADKGRHHAHDHRREMLPALRSDGLEWRPERRAYVSPLGHLFALRDGGWVAAGALALPPFHGRRRFISLRYANGCLTVRGLTWSNGDVVEGYSNFSGFSAALAGEVGAGPDLGGRACSAGSRYRRGSRGSRVGSSWPAR
jgi:hypothetical protein